jgi:hypothetical protein
MDIQSASVNLSQARLQEQASLAIQAMSLDAMKVQSADLQKLLASTQAISDPNLGNSVNILS